MDMFNGLQITVSDHALKDTEERLFPTSKNRSKRIHKKLVKRFGGEFRRIPAIFKTPHGLIAHPEMYSELKRQFAVEKAVLTGYSRDPLLGRY